MDAMGELLDDERGEMLLGAAEYGTQAYILWAEISDLPDDPRPRDPIEVCNLFAEAVAADWLSIDSSSADAVHMFFERWDPKKGSSFGSMWNILVLSS